MNPRSWLFKNYTFFRRYAEGILLTVFLGLVLRLFVVSSLEVTNMIMAPTLVPGDFLVAYKLPFGLRVPGFDYKIGRGNPRRGELVMFPCPSKPSESCVRRVVGLPGDRIEVAGERLIINGETAKYRPLKSKSWGLVFSESLGGRMHKIAISGEENRPRFGPVIVAPGQVFVLSDHRDLSQDSRLWGGVPVSEIEARVTMIWLSQEWPTESNSSRSNGVRWDRVFHSPD